jgi:hypothetical protein
MYVGTHIFNINMLSSVKNFFFCFVFIKKKKIFSIQIQNKTDHIFPSAGVLLLFSSFEKKKKNDYNKNSFNRKEGKYFFFCEKLKFLTLSPVLWGKICHYGFEMNHFNHGSGTTTKSTQFINKPDLVFCMLLFWFY